MKSPRCRHHISAESPSRTTACRPSFSIAPRTGGVAGALCAVLVLSIVACASGTGGGGSTAPIGGAAWGARNQDTVRAARLIFVGDTGTGNDIALGIADQIRHQATAVPLSHVFLLGDNIYASNRHRRRGPLGRGGYHVFRQENVYGSIASKFLDVYQGVLRLGVRIHAALGNHDLDHCRESGQRPVPRNEYAYQRSPRCSVHSQLATPEFGYPRNFRYYSIEVSGEHSDRRSKWGGRQHHRLSDEPPLVEVFLLDSNTLGRDQNELRSGSDEPQLRWLTKALQRSSARWKVVAMHHPIYTPERCSIRSWFCRGEDEVLRAELEPILLEHGVDVVFQGHQHLYARLRPQRGIRYFVTGAGGKKPNRFQPDEQTVWRKDRGAFNHFVYVRATQDQFGYCVIDATGRLLDGGSFSRGDSTDVQVSPCSALKTGH